MDFEIPQEVQAKLAELDAFIEKEIRPLEREQPHTSTIAGNTRALIGKPTGHRAASGRSCSPRCGAAPIKRGHPALCAAQRARRAGRHNLAMAIVREHLAARGSGLHNDLQNESSIVGNFPQ